MSAGVIDTRNFAADYEQVKKRLRLVQQQISNPDIQIGAGGGGSGSNEFNEVVILNPGSGDDIIIGFDVSPPTGLGASTSTYLEEVYIDLSWTAPVGVAIAEYEVELARRTAPGVYDQARVYRTASTSIRLIVPLGGVTYGLRVASINYLGVRSSFTSRIDVTTAVDSTIPPAVSNLAVAAAVNTIVVSFDRLTALEAEDMQNGQGIYRIQLSDDDFTSLVSEKFTSSNVESFSGLTQGVDYKVRVAAVDPSGNQGPWTTSSNVQPGYVTDSVVEPGTISGDRIVAASITGAEILAGSVDGDRITANTLEANRLTTSTLTAADITLAGGSLVAGTPVTGDGALLNSQGFKLYKDGQLTVNLDALTGDATFTGDLVGATMYGGEILSGSIKGEDTAVSNLIVNGNFNTDLSGWTVDSASTDITFERVASPSSPLNTATGEEPYARFFVNLAAQTNEFKGIESSDYFSVDPDEVYYLRLKARYIVTAANTGMTFAVRLQVFNSSNVAISTTTIGSRSFIVGESGTFEEEFARSFLVPSDPAIVKAKLHIDVSQMATGEEVIIDDISFQKSPKISGLLFRSRSEDQPSINILTDQTVTGSSRHKIVFEQDSPGTEEYNPATIEQFNFFDSIYREDPNQYGVLMIQSGYWDSGPIRQSFIKLTSASQNETYNVDDVEVNAGKITMLAGSTNLILHNKSHNPYSQIAARLFIDNTIDIQQRLDADEGIWDFVTIPLVGNSTPGATTRNFQIHWPNGEIVASSYHVRIDGSGSELRFGQRLGEHIKIWEDTNNSYGIGMQNGHMYSRGDGFAWFYRGEHNDTALNPGSGGSLMAYLNTGGLFFGASTRQMLNLYNENYAIGVQSSTLYFRTGNQFAWFRGGIHSDTALSPGSGGTALMVLNNTGDLLVGKTANNVNTDGTEVRDEGYLISTASSAANIGLWVIHQGSANAVGSAMARFYGTTTLVGSITQGASANVAYNTTSHGPWKGNIEDLDDDAAIERLESWRPVSFQWRWDETGNLSELAEPSGPRTHGFIAQELYGVQPHAVTPGSGTEEEHRDWLRRREEAEANGEEFREMDPFTPWAVDQSALVPDLTAATQAIVRRLRRAEAEISELKAMVS